MSELFADPATWLPLAFAALMGLSILIYVILDGFDLGIGLLLPLATDADKDKMIASIGPFWDANETWLVLAVGLLLVAFPVAHGVVLTALYLPVAVMLVGLILRGVAFEFRVKAPGEHKNTWNILFFVGSAMTALSQGFMLGLYVVGLDYSPATVAFAILTAVCVAVSYSFIGATWLIYKADGDLQRHAVAHARRSLYGVVAGMALVSIASPWVSARIFDKWFSMPEFLFLLPLPAMSALLVAMLWIMLRNMPFPADRFSWAPFVGASVLFCLAFAGLAYSFYPYVVPEQLTIYSSASAPESLMIILVGALFVLPAIGGYTILSYVIFRGKARALSYD